MATLGLRGAPGGSTTSGDGRPAVTTRRERRRHEQDARRRPWWRRRAPRRLVIALVPLAIGAVGSWVGTLAAFTATVGTSSTFSTGSIQIAANGAATTYAFTALSVSGLVPGAAPTYALLAISNTGTAPLSYTMTTSATSNQLTTDLRLGVTRISGATCDATAYGSGTTLHAEAAGLTLATIATRPLAAGTSENLCFKASLPSTTTNSTQNLTTAATFAFAATS